MAPRSWLWKPAVLRALLKICISRPQRLWRRYVIAVIFVAAMLGTVHAVSLKSVRMLETHAELVSIAGDQRMLSQRILFYMNRYAETGSQSGKDGLAASASAFEKMHRELSARTDLPAEVRTYYSETGEMPLDSLTQRFAAMAIYFPQSGGTERENIREQLNFWAKTELLDRLDGMVALLEGRLAQQLLRLKRIQNAAFVSAVIVLAIEALLIFLPAQISVNRSIRRLERRKNQLQAAFRRMQARNQELYQAHKSLNYAATHDVLTGLANRRALNSYMTRLPQNSAEGDVGICLLKIDLDYFKSVNDMLGHAAGDDVLVRVARLLRKHGKPDDFIARIGGDEFVMVITSRAAPRFVETLADNIVRSVSEPLVIKGKPCRIGASIGYTFASSSTATQDQLLLEADLALYRAKRGGRGIVCRYSEEMRTDIETRNILFEEIRRGFDEGQFRPYIQPQVCTGTGRLLGGEILVRWAHPERGVIPPALFMAAADEAGLLNQIDMLMLQEGLDLLERVRAGGVALPRISFNASPATLRDVHLPDRMMQAVKERYLSPSDVTLEVLESTVVESGEDVAVSIVNRIADSGFNVFLDDFGTGYASISTLSHLRLSGLKLDRSLISPVPENRAESIIGALVGLTEKLGMIIVAEGVESSAQLDVVRDLGCQIMQGFLIAEPMPEDAFVAWYRDRETQAEEARLA
ncbi:EAL domain-containing protein [uncultured Roseobacter sp.]|uniref:putative bifunctional diguanylate cyclase/phosphodiesterase n=1 Tax=uncultured Roseobacter sp. TaxID=114847 RepID=UPI00262515A8|nr:EAL domain-containing protein [uncultured Roseobacter sp.]